MPNFSDYEIEQGDPDQFFKLDGHDFDRGKLTTGSLAVIYVAYKARRGDGEAREILDRAEIVVNSASGVFWPVEEQ